MPARSPMPSSRPGDVKPGWHSVSGSMPRPCGTDVRPEGYGSSGIAFVLGSTESEASRAAPRAGGECRSGAALADARVNAGLDPELIDPDEPLSPEVADTAGGLDLRADDRGQSARVPDPVRRSPGCHGPSGWARVHGNPGADGRHDRGLGSRGGSDGFTLQPTTVPESLELFVDQSSRSCSGGGCTAASTPERPCAITSGWSVLAERRLRARWSIILFSLILYRI